jgi:hypothetical protein
MTSGEKQEAAETIIKAKLPTITTTEVRQHIDAVLPEVRTILVPSTPGTGLKPTRQTKH